jgi:hypothetical protein
MAGHDSKSDTRIQVKCKSCQKEYRVPPNAVGKRAKCTCGSVFIVELPSAQDRPKAWPGNNQKVGTTTDESVVLPFEPWLDFVLTAYCLVCILVAVTSGNSAPSYYQGRPRIPPFVAILILFWGFGVCVLAWTDIKRLRKMGVSMSDSVHSVWATCVGVLPIIIPVYLILRKTGWRKQILARRTGGEAALVVPGTKPLADSPNSLTCPGPEPPGPKISKMAIYALALGLFGFFTIGIAAIAGLIVGIAARWEIRRSETPLRGQVLATVGIIISICAILTGLLFIWALCTNVTR